MTPEREWEQGGCMGQSRAREGEGCMIEREGDGLLRD